MSNEAVQLCEKALNDKSQQLFQAHKQIAEMEKYLKDIGQQAKIKVGPVEGEITPGPHGDNWTTVSMLVVSVLTIYAGIKLINRLFERRSV